MPIIPCLTEYEADIRTANRFVVQVSGNICQHQGCTIEWNFDLNFGEQQHDWEHWSDPQSETAFLHRNAFSGIAATTGVMTVTARVICGENGDTVFGPFSVVISLVDYSSG